MSEIRATTISDAAGTGPVTLTKQSAAKAWVNFNGTGTVAVRDSLNVSSLTDDGVGSYTVNFSNAFNTANFTSAISSGATGSTICSDISYQGWKGTTLCRVGHYEAGSVVDQDSMTLSTHGDLA